ncbi:cytochrome c maturation protein CcmE [Acetonema longum]|uniref:Cytochrome c-type biogenesis protein CcmE, putative n=1 Tax=Acetonema longum DSM 6540 TaxID=1009370 RepID=F7NED9_9FIRM|nr:cytochrome c maturation protein CcmE [Acetonema longum]EGO65651.1 cytochrome c-type biogenesis protein CcmE, putative [Acetonema longum DSM 6540]
MKKRHMIGIGMILAFIAFSAYSFRTALTPYVTFAQARNIKGSVQVRGMLVRDKAIEANGNELQFILRDDTGEEVPVYYRGLMHDGLDRSTGIVVIGKYSDGRFLADQLLVKCPSKYQAGEAKP